MPAVRYRRRYGRRLAGAAAGGALGYIAGNVPGAIIGARAGYRAARGRGGGGNRAGYAKSITAQHDTKTVYKKSRMPRRKRKRWAKFVKKVVAATDDRGTQTFLFNKAHSETKVSLVGGMSQQALVCAHLYGKNGQLAAGELGNRDLYEICQSLIGGGVDDSAKIRFMSGVLDITVTNQRNPGIPENTYEGPLEVDLYHIVYPSNKQLVVNGLGQAYDTATTKVNGGYGLPKVNINDRGATPFDIGQASAITGLKILSKKKYYMGYGQAFTYQIRDPKNYQFDVGTHNDKFCFYQPKMTQSLMIVAKPTALIGDNQAFNFIVGATRSYKLQVEGVSADNSKISNT